MNFSNMTLIATAAFGLEGVVASELKRLGMKDVKGEIGGARFTGSAADAYLCTLRLRCADRVLIVEDYYGHPVSSESAMITGDYNIVNVDFFVEYKISNPERYLYSSNNPEVILKNLIQSQVRNVVGSSTVDSVLTDGKENIQMQVKDLVTEILQKYDIGLTLVDVKIQDSEPPTAQVIEAFKAVETAKQQAETVVNDAKAYQNAQLPQAQAQADQTIRNAEYLKQKRINEAIEQVAMFQAMYEEYARNPEITKSRMYYEAIQLILPGVRLYINTSDANGVEMLLPLETLVQNATKGGTN